MEKEKKIPPQKGESGWGRKTHRSSVQRASIAPDGTGLLCPMHAGNAVVIPCDQSHNVVADHLVLVAVDVVDLRYVQTDASEEGFPPRDWVRADNRVVWCELVARVQGRPARGDELVATCFDSGAEDRLCALGGQRFEEALHWWGHAVVAVIQIVSNW